MKKIWKDMLYSLIVGMLVPLMAFGIVWTNTQASGAYTPQTPPAGTEQTTTAGTEPVAAPMYLTVFLEDGTPCSMELEEYLVGVLLKEMPANFEFEAKKAQAVVARTYALRAHELGKKHPGGAVCTRATCCQAYRDPDAFIAEGGSREALESARDAVYATAGQVLRYDGKLIEATYFSCSGGMTEDAAAVWGSDLPYLQSTPSPGEEGAAHFTDTVQFSADEFARLLNITPQGIPATWFSDIVYTDGGGVQTMVIGGVTFKGTTLRQLLDLNSTAFVLSAVGSTITITTKGFGHRVGMSQYGADAMAVQGSSYDAILAHYYRGTTLEAYRCED